MQTSPKSAASAPQNVTAATHAVVSIVAAACAPPPPRRSRVLPQAGRHVAARARQAVAVGVGVRVPARRRGMVGVRVAVARVGLGQLFAQLLLRQRANILGRDNVRVLRRDDVRVRSLDAGLPDPSSHRPGSARARVPQSCVRSCCSTHQRLSTPRRAARPPRPKLCPQHKPKKLSLSYFPAQKLQPLVLQNPHTSAK